MPKSRPPYPAAFRQQMVQLVRSGRTPGDLAREFEPSAEAIRNWVAQADRDAGKRSDGLRTEEHEEIRRLRREHRRAARRTGNLGKQQFSLPCPADLHVLDDAVRVPPPGEGRVGKHDIESLNRRAEFRLRRAVQRAGQRVSSKDAHPVQSAQGQVHRGEPDHARVHVVAEERRLLQLAHGDAAQRIAEATPTGLVVRLDPQADRQDGRARVPRWSRSGCTSAGGG